MKEEKEKEEEKGKRKKKKKKKKRKILSDNFKINYLPEFLMRHCSSKYE